MSLNQGYFKIFLTVILVLFASSLCAITFYSNDFELSDGGLDEAGSTHYLWEWGIPVSGPFAAHSGSNCWATVLNGDYGNFNVNDQLVITNLDLNAASSAYLVFWHYYDSESGWDGGNVKVSINGGSIWNLIGTSPDPYNDSSIDGLNNEPGWAGMNGAWEKVIMDISAYAGNTVEVGFFFGCDSDYSAYPGWYIDDVEIIESIPVAGSGFASFFPPTRLIGTTNSLTIEFEPEFTMVNGNVRISIPVSEGFVNPQTANSNLPGFVRVISGNGSPVFGEIPSIVNTTNIEVSLTNITAGDSIQIIYGAGFGVALPGSTNTYSFLVQTKGPAESYLPLALSPVIRLTEPIIPPFFTDLESDDGRLIQSGSALGLWEWGNVMNGPWSGYSGSRAWGTDLDSSYLNNADEYLYLNDIDLTAEDFAFLEFMNWYDTETWQDGGAVEISVNNGPWNNLAPDDGYMFTVAGLGGDDGWSGWSGGWNKVEFDLTPYAGDMIDIRFHFGTDAANPWWAGWFIDDIRIGNQAGTGQCSVNPILVSPGSTNSFHFIYTAQNIMNNTKLRLTIPAGWTAPQVSSSNSPGYVRAVSSTGSPVILSPTISGNDIEILITTMDKNDKFEVYYGAGIGSVSPLVESGYSIDCATGKQSSSYAFLNNSPEIYVSDYITTPYFNDFESDNGYFIESGSTHDQWSYGSETMAFMGGYSGLNTWGAPLNGWYMYNDSRSYLNLPSVDLRNEVYAYLDFYYRNDTENGDDGVNISASTDGVNFTVLSSTNYNYSSINGLDGEPGWSGGFGSWYNTGRIDLTSYAGELVQLRFNFGTGSWNAGWSGFYFDDLTIDNDRAGTGSVSSFPEGALSGTTNSLSFVFTADLIMDQAKVRLDIPVLNGWTYPQIASSNSLGYVRVVPGNGSPVISSPVINTNSIEVFITNMNAGDTFTVYYGAGAGALTSSGSGYETFPFLTAGWTEIYLPIAYEPQIVLQSPIIPTYFNDFELDNGLFTEQGSTHRSWEWGMESWYFLGGWSGNNSWGAFLNASYKVNNVRDHLITPPIDLRSEPYASLSFYRYLDTESSKDGGNVSISTDGVNFSVLGSAADYDYSDIPGLDNEPAWSGSGGWTYSALELSHYSGQMIWLSFNFGTDSVNNGWGGFWIDDIFITNTHLPLNGTGVAAFHPAQIFAGETNEYTLRFTAEDDYIDGSVLTFIVPVVDGWTMPQNTNNASMGYVTVQAETGDPSASISMVTGNTIIVFMTNVMTDDQFDIIYGSGAGAVSPATLGSSQFYVNTGGPLDNPSAIADQPVMYIQPLISVPYFNDFEANDGFFADSGSSDFTWEWGVPNSGPWAAASGTNCWATYLNSSYCAWEIRDFLITPLIDLRNDSYAYMSFMMWLDSDNNKDGGNVSISIDDGETWEVVGFNNTYNSPNTVGLDGEKGWTGWLGGWQQMQLDLSPYAGNLIRLRFKFGSDSSGGCYEGWYIDDLYVNNTPMPAAGTGTVVQEPMVFMTNEWNEFSFEYTAEQVIYSGQIQIEIPAAYTIPQIVDNSAAGYVSVDTVNGSPIIDNIPQVSGIGPYTISITVARMEPGDSIEILYGDQSQGGPGAKTSIPIIEDGDGEAIPVRSAGIGESLMILSQSPVVFPLKELNLPVNEVFPGMSAVESFLINVASSHAAPDGWTKTGPMDDGYIETRPGESTYPPDADLYVLSQLINLQDADYARLTLVHQYDMESWQDGGLVMVSSDRGENWDVVGSTNNFYNFQYVSALGTNGWSGFSGGPVTNVLDLSSYIGEEILLMFRFASDSWGTNYPGWRIEQVLIQDIPPPAAGTGEGAISPDVFVTGSTNSWELTYTAKADLSGGSVSVEIPSGFTPPQTAFPANSGYVSVAPGIGSPVISSIPSISGSGPWTLSVSIVDMISNDSFMIIYGDQSGGGRGALAPMIPQQTHFRFFSAGVSENSAEISGSPEVSIIGQVVPPYNWSFDAGGEVPWLEIGSSVPVWEMGSPCSFPWSAWSGFNVWGTKVCGNYPNNAQAYLVSPVIDLTSAVNAYISFRQAYETEIAFDGGRVEISLDEGDSWNTLGSYDDGQYPSEIVTALGDDNGYSGTTPGPWESAVFDLSSYAGSQIMIRFNFSTTETNNFYNGWFIDDIIIEPSLPPVAGKGTAVIDPQGAKPGSTNTFHIDFTSAGTMNGGLVSIQFPSLWSTPTNNPAEFGYISVSAGTGSPVLGAVNFSNNTIRLPVTVMSNNHSFTVIYSNAIVQTNISDAWFYVSTAGTNEIPFTIPNTPHVKVQPLLTPPFTHDFETEDGNWDVSGVFYQWDWGVPSSGPWSAHSGTNVWGMNLFGNYANNAQEYLTSSAIDLTSVPAASLVFWHWYNMESGYDGGNVSISTDGFNFQVLGDYPDDYNSGNFWSLNNEPAWSGDSSFQWVKQSFDLSPYLGKFIWVRFHFASDGSVTYDGWYLDDVSVTTNPPPAAGTGLGTISPLAAVENTTNSLHIKFEAERAMNNGQVRIIIPSGWTPPQTNSSVSNGYIRYSIGSGSPVISSWVLSGTGPWTNTFLLTSMAYGESIVLTYSNAEIPPASTNSEFLVFTAGPGEAPEEIRNSPELSIQDILIPPFTLDFDSDDGNMISTGTHGQWEWGVHPWFNAYSAPKMWGINMDGSWPSYEDGCRDDLITPIIDLSEVNHATLIFWHWYEVPNNYDGGNVWITTNNGSSWNLLGTNQNPYNTPSIEGLNGETGWSGQLGWGMFGPNWEEVVFSLDPYLGNQIQIRFTFGANNDNWTWSGWYIDDISLTTNTPPVAGTGVSTISPPIAIQGSTNTLTVTYKAEQILYSGSSVELVIPGDWTEPQTNNPAQPGYISASAGSASVVIGDLSISGSGPWTNRLAITNMPIGSTVDFVYSLAYSSSAVGFVPFYVLSAGPSETPSVVSNAEYLKVLNVLAVPFTEDFETNNGNWISSDPNGWIWDDIDSWYDPGYAASGSKVWGYKLNQYYQENEDGYLLSPIIDLTPASFASLEFWHWYRTDGWGDGGNIHISTNNGMNFELLGNWPEHYNRDHIYYLDQEPGWSRLDSWWSWEPVVMDLTPYVGHRIQLKFRFVSDEWDSWHEGWMIDDVSVQAKLPPVAGTGTAVIDPVIAEISSTNIFKITYTAAQQINNGYVRIKVPTSWPKPDGNVSVTNASGSPRFGLPVTSPATWYIEVPVTNMLKNESFTVIYGSKTELGVPSTPQTYDFTVASKGDGETYQSINISPEVRLIRKLTIPFTMDFDSSDGELSEADGSQSVWEYGKPKIVGPGLAHSGSKCWGTDLDGYYGKDNLRAGLVTPYIDLQWTTNSGNKFPVTNAYLSFYQYYNIENNKDGGNVSISTDGLVYTVLEPYGESYNGSMVEGLNDQKGFTGNGTNWRRQIFVLDAYLGKRVLIRFNFGSDTFYSSYPGWYIDDLSVIPNTPPQASLQFVESSQMLGIPQIINYTYGIASGDLDNDGDLDVITYNFHDQASKIWRNNGSGAFTLEQDVGINSTYFMELADVDNDGDLDAISGNNDNLFSGREDSIILNDGKAVFAAKPDGFSDNNYVTYGMAVGDIDNDGDVDIISANNGDDTVWLNDGTGSFSLHSQSLWGSKSRAIRMADLDDDGYLDIVIGHSGLEEANRVWINNRSGGFNMQNQDLGLYNVNDLDVADIDRDGDEDIIFGCNGPNQIWTNNGSGQFGYFRSINTNAKYNTMGLRIADANNDGLADVFCANFLGPDKIWINAIPTRGRFEDSGNNLGNLESTHCSTADIDNDGDLDFLVGVYGRESRIWLNMLTTPGAGAVTLKSNSPPQAPSALDISIRDGVAGLNWTGGSDAETSAEQLTYNIRIGYSEGGGDVISVPGGDPNRLHTHPGNVGHTLDWELNDLETISYYYVSVQTIDGGLRGSDWKTIEYYYDPSFPDTNEIKLSDNFLKLNKADQTIISFNLAEPGEVEIYVYDLRGIRVKSFEESGIYPAGYDNANIILWDGTNDAGEKLAPGIYWVVLKGDGFVNKKKILLVW